MPALCGKKGRRMTIKKPSDGLLRQGMENMPEFRIADACWWCRYFCQNGSWSECMQTGKRTNQICVCHWFEPIIKKITRPVRQER